MGIKIYKLEEQAKGSFNGGEIRENKPLGFPQDGGKTKPYSNIFYWANAIANSDSEIGLHPHRGFEIMSIVLEGEIEHYDNHADKWIPLKAGDVQLIRAGRGISHAELMKENSRMFQIWFDPGLQKTLKQDPVYKDYRSEQFTKENKEGYVVQIIKDANGPIVMDSEGIGIKEYTLRMGTHHFDLDRSTIYSIYNLKGRMKINGVDFEEDSFALLQDEESMVIESEGESIMLAVESPLKPKYQTYYELSGW